MSNKRQIRDEVVGRIAGFLATHRKHDDFECHLSLLSHLLPQQASGAPRISLKKLCLSRPDLFVVREQGDSCLVRLRDPKALNVLTKKFSVVSCSAVLTPATVAASTGSATVAPASTEGEVTFSSTCYKDDYDALELEIISYLFNQPNRKTSLPSLGEYCKTRLGVDMKHRLVKFVDSRPGAFARDRDGRQQVWCVFGVRQDVEAYVQGRFGYAADSARLHAFWESLKVGSGESGSQGPEHGKDMKIPDSLGPEFWGEEDFPELTHG